MALFFRVSSISCRSAIRFERILSGGDISRWTGMLLFLPSPSQFHNLLFSIDFRRFNRSALPLTSVGQSCLTRFKMSFKYSSSETVNSVSGGPEKMTVSREDSSGDATFSGDFAASSSLGGVLAATLPSVFEGREKKDEVLPFLDLLFPTAPLAAFETPPPCTAWLARFRISCRTRPVHNQW